MARPGKAEETEKAAAAAASDRAKASPAAAADRNLPKAGDPGLDKEGFDRGNAWRFSAKAAVATLGGGLLTLCVTAAQISYTKYLEVLQRQGEQGIELQRELFQATGGIENEIIIVYNELHNHFGQEPPANLTTNLNRLNDQWRLHRLWFRTRGAQIYGSRVGNRIYNPREESFDSDSCGVQIVAGSPGANENCPARQRAEARRLNELVAGLKADRGAGRPVQLVPNSFQANFRLTRKALDAYLACWARRLDGTTVGRRRCGDAGALLQIVSARVDLMVLAREALSTEIMRQSALED